MPTTLVGLLIFVVLLLPGFAYLIGKERHGTERRASPFRESVSIVAASVTSEIFVLAVFGVIRWQLPSWTPDVSSLVRNPHGYLVGTATLPGQYPEIGGWALGLLALSTLIAYMATWPRVRRAVGKSYLHDRPSRLGGSFSRSGHESARWRWPVS